MRKLREWILRFFGFSGLINRRRSDYEFNAEIESHLRMQIDENVREGMSPEEARRKAILKFGGIESAREAYRDQRGLPVLDVLFQDLTFGARMLRKHPGFTAVAVATLALGIGANTAVFSFVNAILFRPLPFNDPERLVMVYTAYLANDSHRDWIAAPTLDLWRHESACFEGLAARGFGGFALTGDGQPENIPGARFSANIFRLLGVQPELGRDFLPEEEVVGKDHVILIGHELWQRRFGSDVGIIGRSITLNDEIYTVIGVMPPRFAFPEQDTQIWAPLAFSSEQLRDYGTHNYLIYGRLKPQVTVEQANREMSVVAARIAAVDKNYQGAGAEVFSLQEMLVGDLHGALLLLLGAVGLVLLICCVNIANLLLSRSAARAKEFAIRTALGARRQQVIRQLLTEGLLLAALGGVAGVFIAHFGLRSLMRFIPQGLPRVWEGVSVDARALEFTLLITAGAGVLFGLAPALQSRSTVASCDLNEASRGASAGSMRQRVRSGLVVSEIALSVMLLIGAGLMIRSLSHLVAQDLGYNPEHIVSVDVGLPKKKYPTLPDQARFFGQLKAKVDVLPGVEAAGLVRGLPLSGQNGGGDIRIKGSLQPSTGEAWDADWAQVSPGYFQVMRIPLVTGRHFNERDRTNTAPVAIVNETFVKKFKLGPNVLGRLISFGGENDIEIIGVVKDTKRSGLANDQRAEVFRTYAQQCWGFMSLVVRTQMDPAAMTRAIRNELDTLDKDLPLGNVRTMTQLVARSVLPRRFSVQLLSAFAGLALFLAALGLYGVIAFNVAQRQREIGIRVALGARYQDVLSLILRHGMKLVGFGVSIGGCLALGLTRLMRGFLFRVQPTDPVTFGVVLIILGGAALAACWLPARRAAKVDPIVALRSE
jgi:predicted permease